MRQLLRFTLFATAVVTAWPAAAAWTLDGERSQVAFISIKSNDIAEVNRFTQLRGRVNDEGLVTISVPLASVATNIAVRDQRMRELLFNTAEFAMATLTAQLEATTLDAIKTGEIGTVVGEANLTLHGQTQPLTVQVTVAKLTPTTVLVTSQLPVIINAGQFDLTAGIEQLRTLAGLTSISQAVPVTFVLTFVQQPPAP